MLVSAQEDEPGCKDHPLFTRMKGFVIYECESNFDAVEFYVGEDKAQTLEGQKTRHQLFAAGRRADALRAPDPPQLRERGQGHRRRRGLKSDIYLSMKIVKGSSQVWVAVEPANHGTYYSLTVLEIGEMTQEITAGDMLAALNKDGRIALAIHFDTGKATIKAESQKIVGEIAALLKGNPELKVSIEGHTDSTGTPQGNKTLSDERAKAVLAAVAALGVDAARLSSVGWGQDKPVADNSTEEGRAKNRRVEIVKK